MDRLSILKEENLIISKIGMFLRMVEPTLKPLFLRSEIEDGKEELKLYVEDRNDGTWLKYNILDLPDGLGKAVYLAMDLTYRKLFLSCRDCDEGKKSGGIVVLEDFLVDLHPERRKKIIEAITKTFSNIQFVIK